MTKQSESIAIVLWVFAVAPLPVQGHAAAGPTAPSHIFACPAKLTSDDVTVRASKGWTGFYLPGSTLQALDARVWLGRIEDRGVMIGETEQRSDGSVINRFALTGGEPADLPPLDKWIVCDYGDNIYQAFRLAAGTDECTVKFKPDGIDPATKRRRHSLSVITCR